MTRVVLQYVFALLLLVAYSSGCTGWTGDPHFSGLHGQRYDFQGHRDKLFHIYSDPLCLLNAHFRDAGGSNRTVVDAIGLRLGQDLSLVTSIHDVDYRNKTIRLHVTVPSYLARSNATGRSVLMEKLLPDFSQQTAECHSITWRFPRLTILFAEYVLVLSIPYIDQNRTRLSSYFNLHFKPAPARYLENVTNGGVLGVTNHPGMPSLNVSLYQLPHDADILATDAPNCQFHLDRAPRVLELSESNSACPLAAAMRKKKRSSQTMKRDVDCTDCPLGTEAAANCAALCDASGGANGCMETCFPGDSTVTTPSGPKRMSELDVGDLVLDHDGSFTPVVLFGERGTDIDAAYVQVIYREEIDGSLSTLELSMSHYVAVFDVMTGTSQQRFLAGKEIRRGHQVIVHNEKNEQIAVTVLGVNIVKRRGAYAPITLSGTLMVDGVSCSSFVTPFSHQNMMRLTALPRWIAHLLIPKSYRQHRGQSYYNWVYRVAAAILHPILGLPPIRSFPLGRHLNMQWI